MSDLQKRLYEMEVEPPAAVWSRLSIALDEINSDNKIAEKLAETELDPGPEAWTRISDELDDRNIVIQPARKSRVITLRRLAAAAIVAGLLVSSYFIFFNNNTEAPIARKEPAVQNTPLEKDTIFSPVNTPEIETTPTETIAAVAADKASNRNNLPRPSASVKRNFEQQPDQPIALMDNAANAPADNKLEESTFKASLDDLSLVASNNGYMTMVSADGRLVKIPERYSAIAPYMQENSSEMAYLDQLFEESAYWKDKFREWRKTLAQSSITPSADNFFHLVSLLKALQDQ